MLSSFERRFILMTLVACLPVGAAPLSSDYTPVTGAWEQGRELLPFVWQRNPTGRAVVLCKRFTGAHGAWRALVEPAAGAKEAGLWVLGDAAGTRGVLAVLGGNPGVGGYRLKSTDGKVLWADNWAPWEGYHAYVLEAVVKRGAVRIQLFGPAGKMLLSQSPWVTVSPQTTETPGRLGFYTRDGMARFWRPEHSPQPLSPIVADAPNKLRLQYDNSPWTIVGPGTWRWKTSAKKRLRQYAPVERTTAINRQLKGALQKWECHLKLDPGAGGGGMLFQTNERADRGLLAWLGGAFGSGTLMLYELPLTALWSGKQGNWRYNTEYVLRAETKRGKVRAMLLSAAGKVIQDSGWVPVSEQVSARPGCLGFQTWKGTGEFWGFSTATREPGRASSPARSAGLLGDNWEMRGKGAWQWTSAGRQRLRQTNADCDALLLNSNIRGNRGVWRCHVKVDQGAKQAGLLFQVSQDMKQGFELALTDSGVRLKSLAGRTLWEEPTFRPKPGVDYVLEGQVLIDRVAARVLAADGKTVLARSEQVYVPDTNNDRNGILGLVTRHAAAEFWGWEYK